MCGRFTLSANENEIVSHFHLSSGFRMVPRYNISPQHVIPTILQWRGPMDFCTWGFIPSWTKAIDDAIPKGYINARIETIYEKPSFRQAIQQQRCLIPVSGYYEWMQLAKKKQTYFITHENQPLFALAGIWSKWQSPQGVMQTCAILTRESSGNLKRIHERAPVVIPPEMYSLWLTKKENAEELTTNLNDISTQLHARPVSNFVNNAKNEGVACIQPL